MTPSDRCPTCGTTGRKRKCCAHQPTTPSAPSIDCTIYVEKSAAADVREMLKPERREEPVTCRMKFDDPVFRFCAFTTKSPVPVRNGEFMEFVEKSAYDALKANYKAAEDRTEWAVKEIEKLKAERDELQTNEHKMSAALSAKQEIINAIIAEIEQYKTAREDGPAALRDRVLINLKAERDQLRRELEEARVEVERLKGLRREKIDAAIVERDRYRTALERISGRPMSSETAKRIADEALGEKE